MKKDIKSVLSMDNLIFDKIDFERIGSKNDLNEFEFQMEIAIGHSIKTDAYRVTLKMNGVKQEEYSLNISLTGFFTFDADEKLDDPFKNELIQNNAVAIMMPYLRSQISLLTAQPNVDCVVLPPFNINKMLSDQQTDK